MNKWMGGLQWLSQLTIHSQQGWPTLGLNAPIIFPKFLLSIQPKQDLRQFLTSKGFRFESETDTEVIPKVFSCAKSCKIVLDLNQARKKTDRHGNLFSSCSNIFTMSTPRSEKRSHSVSSSRLPSRRLKVGWSVRRFNPLDTRNLSTATCLCCEAIKYKSYEPIPSFLGGQEPLLECNWSLLKKNAKR